MVTIAVLVMTAIAAFTAAPLMAAGGQPYVTDVRIRHTRGFQAAELSEDQQIESVVAPSELDAFSSRTLSDHDISWIHNILAVTNFTALTTAQILDATAGLASYNDRQEMISLHQFLYCK